MILNKIKMILNKVKFNRFLNIKALLMKIKSMIKIKKLSSDKEKLYLINMPMILQLHLVLDLMKIKNNKQFKN